MPAGDFILGEPLWLLLLLLLPLLLFLWRKRGTDGELTFSSLKYLVALGVEPRRHRGKLSFSLLLSSLVFAVLALSRPQMRESTSFTSASGIDIILAIDVSGSMKTDDMFFNGDQTDRLNVARQLAADFVKKRSDDRIGLITFAAHPLSKSPLTLQHDWLSDLLYSLNSREIDQNGTAIGSAIAAASTRLVDRPDSTSKIIILVTDGSNTAGELSPRDAAKFAAELGIRIYTVAIGTEDGRLDAGDTPRPQEFDPQTLQDISSVSNGEYFRAEDAESFAVAFASINQLEKTEAQRKTLYKIKELFTFPLALSLTSLIIALLLPAFTPPIGPN